MRIPIGVTARNEISNLSGLIKSLRTSIEYAERHLPCNFDLTIILNDNTDESSKLLQSLSVPFLETSGGLVEAQRVFANLNKESPFLIFSDADIRLEENAVFEVTKPFFDNSSVCITYAEKIPLKPTRRTFLAEALYLYNLNNGYQGPRHYFNGQFFGIRQWSIPRPNEIHWRPEQNNPFLHLEAGVRCDDIYLSRRVLYEKGPTAICQVPTSIYYRPPETLQGMYRKYQRMILEIERLDVLFPEMKPTHQKWGRRKFRFDILRTKSLIEIMAYGWFILHLRICQIFYKIEKIYFSNFSKTACPTWKPVIETKSEIL